MVVVKVVPQVGVTQSLPGVSQLKVLVLEIKTKRRKSLLFAHVTPRRRGVKLCLDPYGKVHLLMLMFLKRQKQPLNCLLYTSDAADE